MSSKQETVDYIVEQAASAGAVTGRKMFGEYGLYVGEKMVGSICDDQLFVKITQHGRALLDESHDAPPYPGAKPQIKVPGEKWDDAKWLGDLLRGTAEALPAPKPKAKK
jgi:TfoX/Sxy family transcriptional regulator of competence genes